MKINKQDAGFSLVELLVAMVVGLIIVSGAFALHSGTRKTQMASEAQMDMVADARFAIELIAYDLRHAGMWGRTNKDSLIDCKSTDTTACTQTSGGETIPAAITGDCVAGWTYNLSQPISAINDTEGNPYSACIPSGQGHVASTDILEIRYADSNLTDTAALRSGQPYVRSNFINGRVFVGSTAPVLDAHDTSPLTGNHELHAYAYYISDFTDSTDDGIPSLRRVALVNGPALENQTLASGVTDLQVQFGEDIDGVEDTDGNVTVDRYVDPHNVTDWGSVYAAKIWLVMRSDREQSGNVNQVKTFSIAGADKTPGETDRYRYFMVSSVINLRNLKQI